MGFSLQLFRQCALSTLVVAGASCTFGLDDVIAVSPASDSGFLPPDAGDASLEARPFDATTENDATQEVQQGDGCWPQSDAEICALSGVQCGPLQVTNACGVLQSVECGGCSTSAHCVQGICADYVYAWFAGGWSTCSVQCDGGTRSQDVHCERDDGEVVPDSYCTETKPPITQPCGQDPCCVTASTMESGRSCTGGTSDLIVWDDNVAWVQFHFGSDDGSPANQAACAAQCTAWAKSASVTAWCCDLVEDTTTGHSFSCAAHTGASTKSFSNPNSDGGWASLGSCASP